MASVSHSETGNEEKTVTTLGNSYDSDGIRTQKTVTVKEYTLSSGSGGEIPIPDPITPLVVEMSLGEGETAAPDVSTTDPLYVLASTTVQTHSYVTQSGKIIRETVTSADTATQLLDFLYDENGRPFALKYTNGTANPATYYYVLNLQGDVLGLINASGTIVARYTYNAWGEILTATGTMAEINPLRYRGYYYDTETGFYYLQSRYYDPVTHRFINADSLASTGQGVIGTNMFAYCNNRPVIMTDSTGTLPFHTGQIGADSLLFGAGSIGSSRITVPINTGDQKTGNNQYGWSTSSSEEPTFHESEEEKIMPVGHRIDDVDHDYLMELAEKRRQEVISEDEGTDIEDVKPHSAGLASSHKTGGYVTYSSGSIFDNNSLEGYYEGYLKMLEEDGGGVDPTLIQWDR